MKGFDKSYIIHYREVRMQVVKDLGEGFKEVEGS